MHWEWRRDKLCAGPEECGERKTCLCEKCGHEWAIQCTPELCPRCGASWRDLEIQRCARCPLGELERAGDGPVGQLLRRVFDLRFLLERPGFGLGLEDLTAEEFALLKLIERERPELEVKKP